MLLSAALIVRDEADFLEACLSSIDGLVDEIVVVDTGSTDRSVDVARAHGAVIGKHPWDGDFSGPRNRSLDLARGEWILYIDADEQVRPGRHAAIRDLLSTDEEHEAMRVRFVPRVGWTPYRELRVWRHHQDLRFHGSIHENMTDRVLELAERHGRGIATLDDLAIDHFGYEGDQSHKYARDEPMLVAAIEQVPERIFYYDHLARIYEAQGRDEDAEATWRRGMAVARRRATPLPDDRLLWINLVVHRLARERLDGDLPDLVAEALERFPGVPALELAAATHEFATGRAAGAVRRLDAILAMTLDEVMDTQSSFDERVVGEWAWNLLGLCRFELGDDVGAAEAFACAAEADPDQLAYRVRHQLAAARARA